MGENPFHLFTTYVRSDHFNAYMRSLEVLKGHADEDLAKKDAHREVKTSQRDIKTLKEWLTKEYKPMDKWDSKGSLNYTQAQTKVMSDMQNWKTKLLTTSAEQMLYVRGGDFESTWRIDVNSDKISKARGKRIAKYAPANIMGMAANEAAERALGWQPLDKALEYLGYKHRMSSGFFMAEWLHLCAFSWGGLTSVSTKGDLLYRSSDIPGNLVLGTSETNSVMTRFEKAWQNLILDSLDLSSYNSCPKLIVTRNMTDKPVLRDVKNTATGNYSRLESPLLTKEKEIAEAYDFLAFTISYSISFPNGSKFLNEKKCFSLDTTFYPFLRPLYHKLEDQLDQMLYDKMKSMYRPHGTPVPYARGPHNQDGGTINTSHVPYTTLGSLVNYNTVVPSNNNPYTLDDPGARKFWIGHS